MKFLLNQIKLIKFKSLVVQVQRKGTQITLVKTGLRFYQTLIAK